MFFVFLFNLISFTVHSDGIKDRWPINIPESKIFALKNYAILVFNNYIISLKAKDFFQEGDLESIYWYYYIRNGNMDHTILGMLIRYRDFILFSQICKKSDLRKE